MIAICARSMVVARAILRRREFRQAFSHRITHWEFIAREFRSGTRPWPTVSFCVPADPREEIPPAVTAEVAAMLVAAATAEGMDALLVDCSNGTVDFTKEGQSGGRWEMVVPSARCIIAMAQDLLNSRSPTFRAQRRTQPGAARTIEDLDLEFPCELLGILRIRVAHANSDPL